MTSGQIDLERMVAAGELETCTPDASGAAVLLEKARVNHVSAGVLAASDPETAIGALHSGNRKALDAVLLARGLRATKTGGHIASVAGVRATLGGGRVPVLAVYDVVRRIRHLGDYGGAVYQVHSDDVVDNLPASRSLLEACAAAVGIVSVFTAGER